MRLARKPFLSETRRPRRCVKAQRRDRAFRYRLVRLTARDFIHANLDDRAVCDVHVFTIVLSEQKPAGSSQEATHAGVKDRFTDHVSNQHTSERAARFFCSIVLGLRLSLRYRRIDSVCRAARHQPSEFQLDLSGPALSGRLHGNNVPVQRATVDRSTPVSRRDVR